MPWIAALLSLARNDEIEKRTCPHHSFAVIEENMTNLFNQPQTQKNASLSETEKIGWLRLFRAENVGPITFYNLIEYYGSASEALKNLPELAKRGGRKKPFVAPSENDVMREYDALKKMGGNIICAADENYPLALSAIDDAPPVLSYLGDIALAHKSCIAIVGSRNASINGRKFTKKLSGELGARDQIIVSGLARGIDTSAHTGSLKTGTIAVVAGGIDVVYPEENTGLYAQIKQSGLILAESPLGQKPFAQSFPKRNRIVSGLSKATIVAEANMRSGSLITARLAGEQGRDVYAVPGHPMDPRAAGANHLIREGATLIRSADDILEGLMDFSGNHMRESIGRPAPIIMDTGKIEDPPQNAHNMVIDNLSFTPTGVDELVRLCHLSVGQVQMILLDLELAGRIKRLPGNRISLVGE